MVPTLGALQGLMFNAAVMSAATTIFGVVVAFGLIYLILERKKKSLIAVFLLVLVGFGVFYWAMGRRSSISALDMPKSIAVESVHNFPTYQPKAVDPVPLPKSRPHKKRAVRHAMASPLPICPTQ